MMRRDRDIRPRENLIASRPSCRLGLFRARGMARWRHGANHQASTSGISNAARVGAGRRGGKIHGDPATVINAALMALAGRWPLVPRYRRGGGRPPEA